MITISSSELTKCSRVCSIFNALYDMLFHIIATEVELEFPETLRISCLTKQ